MKTTHKINFSLIIINGLLFFTTANAQEQKPIIAKQIIDGTVPGLKYGPKVQQKLTSDNEKEKNYKGGEFEAFLFPDFKKPPQQGISRLSKQAVSNASGPAKLVSDAPQEAQKDNDKKNPVPKSPPTQSEK